RHPPSAPSASPRTDDVVGARVYHDERPGALRGLDVGARAAVAAADRCDHPPHRLETPEEALRGATRGRAPEPLGRVAVGGPVLPRLCACAGLAGRLGVPMGTGTTFNLEGWRCER